LYSSAAPLAFLSLEKNFMVMREMDLDRRWQSLRWEGVSRSVKWRCEE
jgi:hypothetical protein